MDSPQFNVVVNGCVLDGFDASAVLQQLQQQLNLPEAKAQLLIGGKAATVKRACDQPTAEAYCRRLRALGLDAHIAAIARADNATPASAAPSAPHIAPLQRYFADTALSARDIRSAPVFARATAAASVKLGALIAGYAVAALAAIALCLLYLLHYASFVLVPPVLFSATVYLVVTFALAALAALLLRPLLPLQRNARSDNLLAPQQEPALFACVAQICARLELKAPAEIALHAATTNSVNAMPGLKALRAGDYRLTLSLPLLDNASLAHFAGIVAADLATQARGPMLRYRWLLQQTHSRLEDCLAQRDWLSVRAAMLARKMPPKLQRIGAIAAAAISYANRYLQKLSLNVQHIDTALQRVYLREHDRYNAMIAGADRFVPCMILRARLEAAAVDANAKNCEDRLDAALVDDLPALVRHYFEGCEENFARDMQRRWNAETTPRSDEPPIMRERIEFATASACDGLVANDGPALQLLQHRDEHARKVTLAVYRNADLPFDAEHLVAADALAYAATQDMLQRQQAAIYFNDWLRPFRFWSLADYPLIRDMPLQDAAAQLSVCVNEIRRLTPDRARLLAEYERLQNQVRELLLAQHVLAAGKKFAFRYIRYDGTTLAPILEERQSELAAVLEKLAQQEAVMGGRMTLGLRLSGQAERDVHALHDALRLLNDVGARVHKLELDCFQLDQLLERHHRLREADYSAPIKKLETKIDDACSLLMARLADIPYPLDSRHRSLKHFVDAALSAPEAHAQSAILQRAQRLAATLYRVNEKLSRQAAEYGAIAEEAYRIEPIRLIAGD